jgi:hypothetical protein
MSRAGLKNAWPASGLLMPGPVPELAARAVLPRFEDFRPVSHRRDGFTLGLTTAIPEEPPP